MCLGGKKRPLRWVDREEGWVRQELGGCIQSKYIVQHSQRTNKLEKFKIHLKYTQNKMLYVNKHACIIYSINTYIKRTGIFNTMVEN